MLTAMCCFGLWGVKVANRVIRPDVESLVVNYLNSKLAGGVKASTKKGAAVPCVTVERVGGPASSVAHEGAMLTIQAWAASGPIAANLMREVISWIEVMDLPQVWYARQVGGLTNFPDGVTTLARYQYTPLVIAKAGPA